MYRRLGARYLERTLALQQLVLVPVVVVAVWGLGVYVEMSLAEFGRLAVLAAGLQIAFTAMTARGTHRQAAPIAAWQSGERDDETTIEAWCSAASLPWEIVRRSYTAPMGVVLAGFYLVWSLAAVWELDLPAYSVLPLYGGILVLILYSTALRFLGVEQVVRPVLREIARAMPDQTAPEVRGLSFRTRLLAALPAINVITAVVADAVVRRSGAQLADLAFIVLVAIAVAATISLVLSLMLSRSITEPIAELRDAADRLGRGDFTARVPVVTTDETGELARAFNQMAAGLAERERIREVFGTYVDQEVAEHILREGTSLAGEDVEVTMMFLDVRNFTGFAERSEAHQVVATINRLFERAVPIVHAHHGHVDKFVGDGLLAVFGAPRRQDDHADQALAAAVEIVTAVEKEFRGELAIGIGLNSGHVVAGNVGGAGRLEFSVIGDAVNVAARVESATRTTGDSILVSEHTRRLLRTDDHRLEARPQVPLKGKTEAIELYAPV